MNRIYFRLVLFAVLALVILGVGCSGEQPTQAPSTTPSAGEQERGAPSSTAGERAAVEVGTPTDAPSPAGAAKGKGTIKGVLKSPYARTAEGVAFVVDIKGAQFNPPAQNPSMDQKNKIFTPHLLPIVAGSTVDFPNTDDVRHSVYSRDGSSTSFNLGQYPAGEVKQVQFPEAGITHLACNIHTEMSAYVISRPNPYFALIDRRGNFEIRDVPAGQWELSFFHEKIETKTIGVRVEADTEVSVEFTDLKRKR